MIEIIENYGFERDRGNFILYYTGTRKKGVFGKPKEIAVTKPVKGSKKSKAKEVEEMVEFQEKLGYFNTLSGMLKAVADNYVIRKIENGQVKDIKDYLNEFNAIVTRLEEALAKVENLPSPAKIKSNLQQIKNAKKGVSEDDGDEEDEILEDEASEDEDEDDDGEVSEDE